MEPSTDSSLKSIFCASLGAGVSVFVCILPISAEAAAVTARIWTTVGSSVPTAVDLVPGDIVEWKFDISDTSSPSIVASDQICYAQALSVGCPSKTSSTIFSNLTATAYTSSMVPKASQFSGTYSSGNLDLFNIRTISTGPALPPGQTYPITSMEMSMGNNSPPNFTGIIFPGFGFPRILQSLQFGPFYFSKLWTTASASAAGTIVSNSFLGDHIPLSPPGAFVGVTAAAESTVLWSVDKVQFSSASPPQPISVPGPLPILGSTVAIAISRKLRVRIRHSKCTAKPLTSFKIG